MKPFSPAYSCFRLSRQAGFTLLEVLTCAAIVVLLGAIAYPTYTDTVRRTRRAEARSVLMQILMQQERFYSQNGSYVAFSVNTKTGPAAQFRTFSGTTAPASAYEISGAVCAGDTLQNCLQLTATPGTVNVNSSATDPSCGALSITTTGIKSSSVAGKDCW